MAFAGNAYNEATLKSLLNQLLISGMSAPLDNPNLDLRRLHEELLRSRGDTQGQDGRTDRGMYGYGEDNRLSREQKDLRDKRYQDNIGKSEIKSQDRSSFFGGALERNENRGFMQSGFGRWSSGLGDLGDRKPERMEEKARLNNGTRGSRFDDIGIDVSSRSLFNHTLDMAANYRSQNLPFPSSYNTDSLMSSSHLWSSLSDHQGYLYGVNSNYQSHFTIEPPPPNQPKPNCSEKPLGCHTIFIGGLPDEITEDIIRDFMYQCGSIESIRISKGKGDKKFCHLRFVDAESVEIAVGYSGYKLFVNNGDQRYGGRIHVDYAKSREDDIEYEKLLKAKEREARKDETEKPLVLFTESAAAELMHSIRSSSGFQDSFQILAQWLERGECTRKSSSTFYNLLGAVNGHIKRLVKEKRDYEDIVERQKREQFERAKTITAQGAAILNIFNAAFKKRCWDHFSKAQRRNIGEWHQQVEKEIKVSEEEQIGNRQEVGMDLDDEPDHTQTASERSQPEEDDTGEPKPKQMKTQDSSESTSETTQAALEAQDIKFRAQNAGLKALAEKNASLMWEVEDYKKEIIVLKQRFASVFQDKDLQIARLMTAVQGLQNFFQHVTLNMPQQAQNVEVDIVTESDPAREAPEQHEDADLNRNESFSQDTNENEPNGNKMGSENMVEETPTDREITEKDATEEVAEDSKESTIDDQTPAEEIHDENTKEQQQENQERTQNSCHPEIVRLTTKDMTLVGFLCSYLQICPYGATTDQVLVHIQRQVPGVASEEIENVLDSLPMLFIGDGLEFYNKTWKFKQSSR